jgi:hypothetical protein
MSYLLLLYHRGFDETNLSQRKKTAEAAYANQEKTLTADEQVFSS